MALNFINAVDGQDRAVTLGMAQGRLTACAAGPCLNLRGARLLPGLINAHDHLQLNGALPRLRFRAQYRNVSEWIADITPRLGSDPVLLAHRAQPRPKRLLAGGLKNLLSGVTTVLHHDPRDPSLDAPDFPVAVPAPAGWSHSLALDGEVAVQGSRQATLPGGLWVVHAAEGVDDQAQREFERLDALGCIAPGTLLIHGLGLTVAEQRRLAAAGGSLVWCPGSNLHLFGQTLDPNVLFERGRLVLGSDSRISGSQDLLEELRLVRDLTGWSDECLQSWVTAGAAQALGLTDRGRLQPGLRADLLALPAGLPLSQATRADVRLVVVGGQALYADPDLGELLGMVPVWVDGRAKAMAPELARAALEVREPGLEVPSAMALCLSA